jgi:gluconolactonase
MATMLNKSNLIYYFTVFFMQIGFCTYAIATESSITPIYKKGIYEIYDNRAFAVLELNNPLETLSSGYEWLEGPVWVANGNYLLFSDIPKHKVYKYSPENGVSVYLKSSGYSNGLLLNNYDQLVLMQSRSRKIATMSSTLDSPKAEYRTLESHYKGQKLNSPNDGVFGKADQLYFSDPPYGLPDQLLDPEKELTFQGLYVIDKNNEVTLLDKDLIYPNGVALSHDNKTLYVAASNPDKPAWYKYKLGSDGMVEKKSLFYLLPKVSDNSHGLPDGLKIHHSGIIFATGPGGIWLFDKNATLLAKVLLPTISANLAFNESQTRVYVTAHTHLFSVRLKPSFKSFEFKD